MIVPPRPADAIFWQGLQIETGTLIQAKHLRTHEFPWVQGASFLYSLFHCADSSL